MIGTGRQEGKTTKTSSTGKVNNRREAKTSIK